MKKILAIVLSMFFTALVLSAQVNINTSTQKAEIKVNRVYVKATMPDKTEVQAITAEDGALKITVGEKYYEFEPRIIDIEGKSAFMVNTYSNLNAGDVEDFQFEILNITSSPLDDIQPMACECCVTCGDITVCACGVKMDCDKCCCAACCKYIL